MLDALVARVGPGGGPVSLADLHRAYVASVPFDDLTIQLGEQAPLDVEAVAARPLTGDGRSGYCFEVNGVLADADDLAATLRIGITLRDTQVARLWDAVSAQHAAWLTARDGD